MAPDNNKNPGDIFQGVGDPQTGLSKNTGATHGRRCSGVLCDSSSCRKVLRVEYCMLEDV